MRADLIDQPTRQTRSDSKKSRFSTPFAAGYLQRWLPLLADSELSQSVFQNEKIGKMVGALGLEPRTSGLKGRCSTD